MQFTANAEYVDLVDRARSLLSHCTPRLTLDALHVRALRALVTELERQKYAVTSRPRKHSRIGAQEELPATPDEHDLPAPAAGDRATALTADAPDSDLSSADTRTEHEPHREQPRRRGRHVPAAVRRAVFERDQGRCTYTEPSGRRCSETRGIELHHLLAFARGGEHTEQNLCLRCRAHNALAAEEDFGKEFVEQARGSIDHEPWPK